MPGGVLVGIGGNCKDHLDPGRTLECKKSVTMGDSGLSYETLRLRMKRWLVAGLDEDGWTDDKRTVHVGMGGKTFLTEFAEGLDEQALDTIANSLGPPE
jgi:hypothetical protein